MDRGTKHALVRAISGLTRFHAAKTLVTLEMCLAFGAAMMEISVVRLTTAGVNIQAENVFGAR